jgi:hypothetical protein
MTQADKHQIQGTKMIHLSGLRHRVTRNFGLIVLIIWSSLYLPNIANTPRWYGDETITLACGQDLARGVFANRAVWNTYINQPQHGYAPIVWHNINLK